MKKSVLFTSLLVLSSLALAACGGAVTIKELATAAATTKYTQWLNPKKCLVPIRPLRQMK